MIIFQIPKLVIYSYIYIKRSGIFKIGDAIRLSPMLAHFEVKWSSLRWSLINNSPNSLFEWASYPLAMFLFARHVLPSRVQVLDSCSLENMEENWKHTALVVIDMQVWAFSLFPSLLLSLPWFSKTVSFHVWLWFRRKILYTKMVLCE